MFIWLVSITIVLWFCLAPFAIYLYEPQSLRKYPNQNFLSGFTSLAYVYERLNSFRTRELRAQHEKHPILRTGPTALSFASVGAIKDIYGNGSPCLKDDVYKSITGDHSHVLNVVDRCDHARKRRMLSHAFAAQNLEQWEFKITDKVEKLVAQFDRRCTSSLSMGALVSPDDLTVDFRWWSNLFTFDAIADIALSERLGLIESGSDFLESDMGHGAQTLGLIDSLHCGSRAASRFVGATDWFHLLKTLYKLLSPHFRAHGDDFGKIVSLLTNRRLQRYHDDAELSDFVNCLIEDKSKKRRNLDLGDIEAKTSILCK